MKKSVLLLAFCASLVSCNVVSDDVLPSTTTASASGKIEDNSSKSNSNNGASSGSPISMTAIIGGNDWKVTSYIDNKNRDRTSRYSSYTFAYNSTGGVSVKSGGKVVVTGTWKAVVDSGKDKFYLTLTTTDSNLSEFNEDWIIITKTATTLKLQNISGGNGGTTTLIFSR